MRSLTGCDFFPDLRGSGICRNFRKTCVCGLAGAFRPVSTENFLPATGRRVCRAVALFRPHYLLYLCKKNDAVAFLAQNTYSSRGTFYFHAHHQYGQSGAACCARGAGCGMVRFDHRDPDLFSEKVALYEAGPVYHHKFSKGKTGPAGPISVKRKGHGRPRPSPGGSKGLQIARWGRAQLSKALFPRTGDYISAASAC